MTLLATLVTGPSAAQRENAIVAEFEPSLNTVALLEGLPDGSSRLDAFENSSFRIVRIAPGCLCCVGNLTMRVTLNRILRKPPDRLYIGLANVEHLSRIRTFLSEAPYNALLQLTKDLHA